MRNSQLAVALGARCSLDLEARYRALLAVCQEQGGSGRGNGFDQQVIVEMKQIRWTKSR